MAGIQATGLKAYRTFTGTCAAIPLRLIAVALAAVIAAALAVSFGQVDWYPQLSTYGVSAGTGSVYCSAELVHGWLVAGCERAS
jgi:hypothetical protein